MRIINLIILVVSATLLFTCSNKKSTKDDLLSHYLREPKNEIPAIYNLSWRVYQDSLKVDSMKVKILESDLNMFNDKSLISYSVYGHINSMKNSYPKIEQVQINEKVNTDSISNCDGIIEITPIVSFDVKENTPKNRAQFNFTNEIIVNSLHWGTNLIKFTCQDKTQTIQLDQSK